MNKSLVIGFTACITLSVAGFATPSFAGTYECFRYVNGKPTGTWVKVQASSKSDAAAKALVKMKKIGGRVDSVNCK